MLEISVEFKKGAIFIYLEGILNNETFNQFDMELSYLLYKQGVNQFVVDFNNVEIFNYEVMFRIENKMKEILLNRGNIIFCGFNNRFEKIFYRQNFYVREGCCGYKYLNI